MQKRLLFLCFLFFLLALPACGKSAPKGEVTTAVTWEELLEANRLEAVLEKAGGFINTATEDGSDSDAEDRYLHRAVMKDGVLLASVGTLGNTTDLVNGIRYHAAIEEEDPYISIIAPTADQLQLVDGSAEENLQDFVPTGAIYQNDGRYFVPIRLTEEESGIKAVTEGYAFFHEETLLLERMEMTTEIGAWGGIWDMHYTSTMTYPDGEDFATPSYDAIVHAEDAVALTIHYPDGSTADITVDRNTAISAYHPNHTEVWSVCKDAACTESIDDLGWISGDHGDIYLFAGDVPPAPPALTRVLEKSSFAEMFADNYSTYFQRIDRMDENENLIGCSDLAWYLDDDGGLCLGFEQKDADYNILHSALGKDMAWYSWTAEDGYTVDFYDDFSYAEGLVQDHRIFLPEEHLLAPMQQEEPYAPYYIPYTEPLADGNTCSHKYWIHSGSDYIEWIERTYKDAAGNKTGIEICYIGGNGPMPMEMDVFAAVSEPTDEKAVQLTVISPTGEKTYSIRRDAKIFWKGDPLYQDADCTKAVQELSWIKGGKGTVYAKE